MPRKAHPHQDVELQSLIARIQNVNPTGKALRRSEERIRYAEKAHLQSLLLENYPEDVRVRFHDDMPGIVSLSIPRLQASGGHAVVEALSAAARHWIDMLGRDDDGTSSSLAASRSKKTTESNSFVDRAEKHLAEYDFDCAIQALHDGLEDSSTSNEECIRALLLLLEIHVDHLANHDAALELESELQNRGGLSERSLGRKTPQAVRTLKGSSRAHELLGLAASRTGDIPRALHHFSKCQHESVGPEIAAIARISAQASQWAHAREAYLHLSFLATHAEQLVGKLRNDLRDEFVQSALDKRNEELEADAELFRFVREFAPGHPWLIARRQQEQKTRLESSVRTALQKARTAKSTGNFEETSLILETMDEQGSSPADIWEIAELRAWAEERRAAAQAIRIISLVQAQNFDAACHAYISASSRTRDIVLAQEPDALFTTLESLNTVFPERANARPHLRAAVAWARAMGLPDETIAWSLLSPHVGLLQAISTIAPLLQEIRQRADLGRARVEVGLASDHVERHDICIEGDCFSEWLGNPEDIQPVRIARQALRIGADSYVLTVGQTKSDSTCIISLWPCRSTAASRHVLIRELDLQRSLRVVTQKQRALIWDDDGHLWLIDLTQGPTVKRIYSSQAAAGRPNAVLLAIDDDHCAMRVDGEEDENEVWRVIHVPSGVVRAELQGPRLYCFRSLQGASFYRARGAFLDRLNSNGQVVESLELPKYVSPWTLVEIPGIAHPVVISAAIVRSCVLVWWPSSPGFFRGFELFDIEDHGEYLDAWGLADRGMYVLTQRKDQCVYWHEMTMVKGVLRPGRRRQVNFDSCSLVHDPSGKRAWVVRSVNQAPIEVHEAMVWFEQS